MKDSIVNDYDRIFVIINNCLTEYLYRSGIYVPEEYGAYGDFKLYYMQNQSLKTHKLLNRYIDLFIYEIMKLIEKSMYIHSCLGFQKDCG